MSTKPEDVYPNSSAYRGLLPLRVPAGWSIGWNTLSAGLDPAKGDLGGSSLFYAVNEGRRFVVDVMARPEFDPDGAFVIEVTYQPYPRTEKGRRRDTPFALDGNAEIVHRFETRAYAEAVEHLKHWLARCTVWVREGH